MAKIIYPRSSTSTSHFTTAISAGSVETETFPSIPCDGTAKILSLSISSKDNLAWQIEIYDSDSNIAYKHAFEASDATLYGNDYHYGVVKLDWHIARSLPSSESTTLPNKMGTGGALTVGLRNNSGEAKTAGTSGAVIITFMVEQ